ncbi:MAG TPA: hypothetical protein VNS19_08400 [Acidimicrobiales bacterium]|nr:hypothetical protein [Acidimicrobiales bacterium]
MLLFAFAALVAAAVLVLIWVLARSAGQGCRYRCTCVADSAALGALASVVKDPPHGHGH